MEFRDEFRLLADEASDLYTGHDRDGRLLFASRTCQDYLGYAPEQVVGAVPFDFCHPEEQMALRAIGEALRETEGPVQGRFRFRNREGRYVAMRLTVGRWGTGGEFLAISRPVDVDGLSEQRLRANERRRVGMALHTGALQTLLGARLKLQAAMGEKAELPVAWRKGLALVDLGLRELRDLGRGLLPGLTWEGGLAEGIRKVARTFRQRSGCEVAVRVTGSETVLPEGWKQQLYLLVLEALRNVERHAEASSVEVDLELGADGVRLIVADDGKGISKKSSLGWGLSIMRDRVLEMGGDLEIRGRDPAGTEVSVRLPSTPGGSDLNE